MPGGDQLKQLSILPARRKGKKNKQAVKNGFHTWMIWQ